MLCEKKGGVGIKRVDLDPGKWNTKDNFVRVVPDTS